jgi:outer membrane lipoprotein SlyB
MKLLTPLALTLAAVAFPAAAQIVLYEHDRFHGRTLQADKAVKNFERSNFNDTASSVVVFRDKWEVCENARFEGRCVVLRPGRYPSLSSMGLNDRLSSVRKVGSNDRVEDHRYSPPQPYQQMPVYDNRRRNNERLYEANVTSVRAVVGPTEQRCWIEQQQSSQMNIPGAIIGGVLGGVIGHQVGGGRGQDVATAVGAVGGAAVGANVGRNSQTQEVRRCADVPTQARADYYDVTYNYKGVEHRMQTANPPGKTVSVNNRGEPRA